MIRNYATNAVRDSNNPSPMQVSSSVLSGVFCGVLMFVLRYIRAKHPQIDFATTFASMIGSFALTTNASVSGFQPNITVCTKLLPCCLLLLIANNLKVVHLRQATPLRFSDCIGRQHFYMA
ncbi:unnamed protein product [Mucor hiemalis]